MTHIKVKRGLDIPIKGAPAEGEVSPLITPPQIALDLTPFQELKFSLLVKVGDVVKIGQPLAEDKGCPGRMFVAPAAGTIKDIKRGAKRVLESILIDVAKQETYEDFHPVDPKQLAPREIIQRLKTAGHFAHIRSRPFNMLADLTKEPRCIFVKAVESAPFIPPAELQVAGHEKEFQAGLQALAKLTQGAVHLVYRKDTPCKAFSEAQQVTRHTVEGPHPAANVSLHIQEISPVQGPDDIIWTLTARDVVAIGHLFVHGRYYVERVISIAGPGLLPDRVGYFKARAGYPIGALIAGRIQKGVLRFISGDPLMGHRVEVTDFLGFYDTVFCVIPENDEREFLHFFRLGLNKFTASKAYLSGHLDSRQREYDFTTNQHGEHRAFIDSTLYDKVMPLNVPTMLLVKAVMAEDYELADKYGLLEVDCEDFALPSFVCPSKMEMVEIIKKGIQDYSKEVLQ